jgi:hypothetical protein
MMAAPTLLSIIESPAHPDFSALYQRLGIREERATSTRKAMSLLKSMTPEYVVAEFFYGYGNNYAGVNVSNLDVFLYSLQKYAPQAHIIVLVDKEERGFVEKLDSLFHLHAVLQHPVREADLEAVLGE